MTWLEQGLIARNIVSILSGKISALLGVKVIIGKDNFEEWFEAFKSVSLDKKRALLVTIANDICKLGVFQESDIIGRIDEVLNDIPGFLAGSREFTNDRANTNDNTNDNTNKGAS